MTKDLIVTFGKGDGSTHDWKYKGLNPDLPVPKIKEACELLTKLDITTQNGVKLFDSVVTAKVVKYIDTLIFDPEHEAQNVNYYGEPGKEAEPTCEEVGCFEVADEPKQTEQDTLATPKPTALPKAPLGRYFKQLTSIEPTETSEVTVEKDAFPQMKPKPIEKKEHKQEFELPTESYLSQDKQERNGLLYWLHRIRKKNKEGPAEIPRE